MRKSVVLGASIAFALGCVGCAAAPGATFHQYELTIVQDAAGCPTAVNPDPTQPACPRDRAKKCVTKADKVKWVAQRDTHSFDIHFDPFRGSTVHGSCRAGTCQTPPKPIDPGAPPSDATQGEVEYKYTVAIEGCAPLDPPIFIQR